MSEGSESKLEKPPSLFDRIFPEAAPAVLGDFTTTRRVVPIALSFDQRRAQDAARGGRGGRCWPHGDGRGQKRGKPSQSVAFRA
jgi:hypothetical protein